MRIKKIATIKNYKSFLDFSWKNFCKNTDGREQVLQKFSIVFGDNGAGKTAICDVLKSVSKTQDFPSNSPKTAEIEISDGINNQICKYENKAWTGQINEKTILFFDIDFVNENVHTHGLRSSNLQQGAHTQESGKLVVDLDKHANELKKTAGEEKEELETLKESYSEILQRQFTEKDQEFFIIYKNIDKEAKEKTLAEIRGNLKKLETDTQALERLAEKHSEISNLSSLKQIAFSNSLSAKTTYTELFTRQIKKKAQDEADAEIKVHFERHKQFIEHSIEQIPSNYKDENCPLCMQPLANASKVIEYYRNAFDQNYKKEKQKFLKDIQTARDEVGTLKSNLESLPQKVTSIFDGLEKIKTDFEIQGIYKLEEKTKQARIFSDVPTAEIDEMLVALESLKSIDRKQIDVAKAYDKITSMSVQKEKAVALINNFITEKNEGIKDFKDKYSDRNRITEEIQQIALKRTELTEKLNFLESEKIELMKKQKEATKKTEKKSGELKKAEDELGHYLADTIPQNIIAQMVDIIEKFNLTFKLEHIKPSAKTKNYPFSFKVKDRRGNERKLKDGLSEGERHLISLAFFFAINENLQNKDKTVLVFDDPITSLDSPNLKILAEIIHKKTQEFAQVIVFTHHPLFFKYLAKCTDPNPCKFNVLKNADEFGGSFMFPDRGFDLTSEVQKCQKEINQKARNGTLKLEEIALKYGQLLRLAVEKFIKNDLLMWDKERNFGELTESLKQGKSKMRKLSDEDLETVKNIYKYCNYSNLLHADKEISSSLSELRTHINKFSQILNKAKI